MKKSNLFLLIFVLFPKFSFAVYGDLGIKQRFDQVYTTLFGPIYNVTLPTTNAANIHANQGTNTWNSANPLQYFANSNDQDALGSTRSGSLEALLRVYEATCDIKYLYEFMQESCIITNMRADKVGQSSSWKYWFINSVYYHGRILQSFTHYVYLIKSNTALYNTSIPSIHRPNFANKTTFGEYAEWLNTSNMEVMDFLTNERYWRGNDECMCKPSSISEGSSCSTKVGSNAIMEMNMQAPFGCSLIYLYLANPTKSIYAERAIQMSRAYLVTHGTILNYHASTNSYRWYHSGWQKNTNGSLRNNFNEDIGHAAFGIMFPLLYNKFYNNFYPSVTGGQYFESYQMVRFRNAFTKIIYNSAVSSTCNSIQASFDCNVVGHCSGHYGSTNYLDYQMNAKNWAGFYLFDNVSGAQSGPSLYNILMDYYITVESCLPINNNNYAGVGIIGLADLLVANYDIENINPCGINQVPLKPSNNSISYNSTDKLITINSEKTTKTIFVYSITGEKVLFVENENEIILDKLLKGIYIVVSEFNDNSIETEKIVIE